MNSFWNGFEKQAVSAEMWGKAFRNRLNNASTATMRKANTASQAVGDKINRMTGQDKLLKQTNARAIPKAIRGFGKDLKGKKNLGLVDQLRMGFDAGGNLARDLGA